MKSLGKIFLILTLAAGAFAGWHFRDQLVAFYNTTFKSSKQTAQPRPDDYQELRQTLARESRRLEGQYAAARTPQEINAVIQDARIALERDLPALMRCWLGTPWAFHGTAKTPGDKPIACGYFVTTILRDAGFKVDRVKLAQQPSQKIIESIVPREEMHIRSGKPYSDYLAEVVSRGPGIRIVGLDTHVAFLMVNAEEGVRFIHSSRSSQKEVVDENRHDANALRASKYRVTGNFTTNAEVLHRWLTGAPFPTKL